jgi:hypothetical protein
MQATFCADPLSMIELIDLIEEHLDRHGQITLNALNPDLYPHLYNGERVVHNGHDITLIHLKAWVDLAEVCSAKLNLPSVQGDRLLLTFRRLNQNKTFHRSHTLGPEKYGASSLYSRIHKNSDPHFVKDYSEALERCQLDRHCSILNVGVNRGDEFDLLGQLQQQAVSVNCLGLDHSKSALQSSPPLPKHLGSNYICADIEHIPLKAEQQFDALISINTLHGSKFDGKKVFRSLFQNHLKKKSSIILGFPNCRYRDGEVLYGGKMKNYTRHDFSLLVKDLQYFKKYCQSHKKKVFITGKYTLLLTAIPA